MQSHISDIVLSLSGRDKDKIMIIVKEDDDYIYLANGKGRRAENPKRKKRKHVAYKGACDEWTKQRLFVNGRLTNSEIRKALAIFKQDAPDKGDLFPQSN